MSDTFVKRYGNKQGREEHPSLFASIRLDFSNNALLSGLKNLLRVSQIGQFQALLHSLLYFLLPRLVFLCRGNRFLAEREEGFVEQGTIRSLLKSQAHTNLDWLST